MGFVLVVYDRHLIAALQFRDRSLRDKDGVLASFRFCPDASKLAGPENTVGVWEVADQLNRACGRINFARRVNKSSAVRVNRAVGKDELQLQFLLVCRALGHVCVLPPISEIRLFAGGEENSNWIESGNCRQNRSTGADQISDLRQGDAGEAVNRRRDFGEPEIHLSGLDRRLVGFDLSLGSEIGLVGGVVFLLADGVFFCQRRVTLDVPGGSALFSLILCEFGFGLIEGGLEWAGVNLKKEVARLYRFAFAVVLLQKIADDLRVNLSVYQSVERPNPFLVNRSVAWLDGRHQYFRRRRRWGRLFPAAVHHGDANQKQPDSPGNPSEFKRVPTAHYTLFIRMTVFPLANPTGAARAYKVGQYPMRLGSGAGAPDPGASSLA